MRNARWNVSFCFLVGVMGWQTGAAAAPAAPIPVFDIRAHGAVGDGKTHDTKAINAAVGACSAAGGGHVLFPPGRYLSGTIHLKSNVTLFLAAGARLVGTKVLEQYQHFTAPKDTFEGRFTRWHRALLLGDGIQNVSILGTGIIDGNKVFDARGEERMRGPHTVLIGNSRGITIRGISMVDSANYAVMLEFCQDVDVHDVLFTGGWDGVHFRGWPGRPCRNVQITGCRFFTGDDAIAGRYWENVLISDCVINSSCNGIRLIGPAVGLMIHDCLFYGPGLHPHRTQSRHNMLSGIILQPGAWDRTEGKLDDVLIADVTMKRVASPVTVWFKDGNTGGTITVSGLNATGVYRSAASVESWAKTSVERVVFRDVTVEYEGGGKVAAAAESPHVDARGLPAWGLYARNVKNLILEDVRLTCAKKDTRPVVACDGVERLVLDEFRFPRYDGVTEPLLLKNVGTVERSGARPPR